MKKEVCFVGSTMIPIESKLEELMSFEDGTVPDYIKSIHRPLSASAEATFECEVNSSILAKLVGVDLARNSDHTAGYTLECKNPYLVQVRRHKKKRINKKWAKRYGYKTKFKTIRVTDVTVIPRSETEFEFVGRPTTYIH